MSIKDITFSKGLLLGFSLAIGFGLAQFVLSILSSVLNSVIWSLIKS